jgi:Ca2+-binding RTX toxin-like protein
MKPSTEINLTRDSDNYTVNILTGQHVNGMGGDDTIQGNIGADFLNGGTGDDNLDGGDGNDTLQGGAGDDTVQGGAGDDVISTASGGDVVAFRFTLGGGSETHTFHYDGATPPTEPDFVHQYDAWLASFGKDVDGDGQVSVSNAQGSADETPVIEGFTGTFGAVKEEVDVQAGKSGTHERYVVDVITQGGGVTSPDGHDTVTDFDASTDHLDFGALMNNPAFTEAQFDQYFKVEVVNADGELTANDVKISLADDTWSVTLLNPQNMPGTSLHDIYGMIFG